MRTKSLFPAIILLTVIFTASAQNEWAVLDENLIQPYELPAILVTESGKKITTVQEWEAERGELLTLFSEQMYGKAPDDKLTITCKTVEQSDKALEGKAIRKQIIATFAANGKTAEMNILIYLPKKAKQPVPVFFGLNFYGNQTVLDDPAILTNNAYALNVNEKGIYNNKSSEAIRGIQASRWCIERIIEEGYGVVTAYYCEIYPDHAEGKNEGIAALLSKKSGREGTLQWNAIGAWAWGISRIMDYIETDNDIDAKKVVLFGHSRLGKTALWAGAQDQRFAAVISNNSGCGGAALYKRKFGETALIINTYFPHWFCSQFKWYINREELLPIDQHQLIALIAPRPVYIASAEDDLWADPKGEFLSAYHAGEAYNLYGLKGIESEQMPLVNSPVGDRVGYHIRTGEHNVTLYDWECFLKFAKRVVFYEK